MTGFAERVGPCYGVAGYAEWAGTSEEAVLRRLQERQLVGYQHDGRIWAIPGWQFQSDRTPHPAIITLWKTLRAEADPWTAVMWLIAAPPETDGLAAAAWLRQRPVRAGSDGARGRAALAAVTDRQTPALTLPSRAFLPEAWSRFRGHVDKRHYGENSGNAD